MAFPCFNYRKGICAKSENFLFIYGPKYPEEIREFVDVDVVLERMGINSTGPHRGNQETKIGKEKSDDEGETGWKIRVPDIKFTSRRVTIKLRVEKGPKGTARLQEVLRLWENGRIDQE